MLRGDLHGKKILKKKKKRGLYVYIQLIHFAVQQKLTQHCNYTPMKFFLKIWELEIWLTKQRLDRDQGTVAQDWQK